MIEKMRFVNIMGPVDKLDETILEYLYPCEIQIESATKELAKAHNIGGFDEENIYTDALLTASKFYRLSEGDQKAGSAKKDTAGRLVKKQGMSVQDAIAFVNALNEQHEKQLLEIEMYQEEITKKEASRNLLLPYKNMNFNFEEIFQLRFIKYRFGRMPRMNYEQLKGRIFEEDMIFVRALKDEDYVYGVYFVPEPYRERIDALFSSVHFEVFTFPDILKGSVLQNCEDISKEIERLEQKIKEANLVLRDGLEESKATIYEAYHEIQKHYGCFSVRKFAARTVDDFFILVGWMAQKDAAKLEQDLEKHKDIIFILEVENSDIATSPPTKLKNNGFVRPFEFFIKMYGLPAYNEIDPTPILAVTYSFLFGIMFADVGQGAIISILGLLLYRFKGYALGAIMAIIGVFSVVFGFLFGSFFGHEFPPLWFSPMEVINPDFGMYQILILAIILGVCIIVMVMLLQIYNAWKRKDIGGMLFDTNAVAGLVFYGAVIAILVSTLTKAYTIATGLVVLFIAVPLLLMALKTPLSRLLEGKKPLIKSSMGDFILETVFELFEVLLSYMANTISFVRVGAFVLSHAGMMSVVLMMADGKSIIAKILITIIGNIIVIGFEGLIVGIQVLRLQYYEMFSRFYRGTGRAFEPYEMGSINV